MAGTVQVNYDEMENIIKLMQSEENELRALLQQTKGKVESLHGNQWVGQGADKFFNEMEGTVLPAMGRMVQALDIAGNVAKQIIHTIHSADEGTKSFFSNIG